MSEETQLTASPAGDPFEELLGTGVSLVIAFKVGLVMAFLGGANALRANPAIVGPTGSLLLGGGLLAISLGIGWSAFRSGEWRPVVSGIRHRPLIWTGYLAMFFMGAMSMMGIAGNDEIGGALIHLIPML